MSDTDREADENSLFTGEMPSTLLTIYLYFVVEVLTVKEGREGMRVVEIETQDQQRCYVVIDDERMLIEPIVRYLKYLDRVGAARNTLRSYATVLMQYWEYLS